MITVKVLGSLGKKLGRNIFTFTQNSVELAKVVKTVYGVKDEMVDCSELLSSVLIAVNGVAVSSGIEETVLESGDTVTLIPISHGG
jgi:molybdopterin converting factor small subunit